MSMEPLRIKRPTQEELDEGEPGEFGKGDLVTFPQGVGCKWDVREPLRKHYSFG